MINSKYMLHKKLKENKDKLIFETIYNEVKPEYVGTKRKKIEIIEE